MDDIALPRILCVDDEPFLLAALSRSLRLCFDVCTAANAKDALLEVEHTGPFVAVISDMSMPGMDGIELLRRVRDLNPATMRILLSGHGAGVLAARGIDDDLVAHCFCKPCSLDVLAKTIVSAAPLQSSIKSFDVDLMNCASAPI